MRLAIGGSRPRQIQLLLTESLLLSVLGGGAGLVVARVGLSTLIELVPANIPRAAEAGLDLGVLAFTLGISLATGLLFGLLPAVQASDVNLVDALKATKSANTNGRRRASSTSLVVIQVALTLMLLVGGSILGKSFFQLRAVERGFRSENILVIDMKGGRFSMRDQNVSNPALGPDSLAAIQRLWSDRYRILEAVRALPGVVSVASGSLPLSLQGGYSGFALQKYENRDDLDQHSEDAIMSRLSYVSPGYFETLGIPIIRGEGVPAWDGVNDWRRYHWRMRCGWCTEMPGVGKVVVSESFAAAAWPGQDPIGKEVGWYPCCWTVAGVAADVSFQAIDHNELPSDFVDAHRVYIPWRQGVLFVRTAADPVAFVPAIRAAVLSIEDMYTIDVSTLDDQIYDSFARPRFHMLVSGIFAAVALLLAIVGLYGVVAYTVAQRTHEIGVRIALGAQREDIRALVVRNGLAPVILGVVLGIAGVLASARVLEALLYGMSALDPGLIAGLSVMLVLVTAAACYVPARRASAVDPVLALSHE